MADLFLSPLSLTDVSIVGLTPIIGSLCSATTLLDSNSRPA
jgi:hypothetical protein